MATKKYRCTHVERGLAVDVQMRLDTVEDGNQTDYVFHMELELCTFCSGFIRGTLSGDQIRAVEVK